jgi:hypothetical protein
MTAVRGGLAIAAALTLGAGAALAQRAPESHDMRLVGFNDLQGRSAYQPVIQKQGNRWILYVGHHGGTRTIPKPVNPLTKQDEFNGTSIIDVTDPRRPKYLAHLPGEEGTYEAGGAQMARVCDGASLPKGDKSAVYLLRPFGNSAHEIWNVAVPEKPVLVKRVSEGLKGTHKSFWECDTGIGYLVSGRGGWRVRRMTEIFDLSDPTAPKKIREFGLTGQQPGATGPTPVDLHGMISLGPKVNRVYFGYGTNTGGVLQIVDREKLLAGPTEPTPENLRYPEVGRFNLSALNGAHTTLPILAMPVAEFQKDKVGKTRNFVAVTNEQILNECLEPRQLLWMVDITAEATPTPVSTWGVPEKPGNFCERGGRFGTHSSNENMPPMYDKRILFIAHFNAGIRAVDIRDPYHPKEIAHYIPALTKNADSRCVKLENGQERCKTAIQTNNLEVDDRGYVYAVDRANNGVVILELSGAARRIANWQAVAGGAATLKPSAAQQ